MNLSIQEMMTINGLEMNIATKLNSIKLSNPLYYHLNHTEFSRAKKKVKKTGDYVSYRESLETIVHSLDKILEGDCDE